MQSAVIASAMSLISQRTLGLLATTNNLPRSTAIAASEEIPFDVFFLRAAKSALRQALEAESGTMNDEDALATVAALSQANPTEPDPSADVELWSGSFKLASAPFSLPQAQIEQCGACQVIISEEGQLDLSGTVALGPDAEQAMLSVKGRVEVRSESELEVLTERIILTCQAEGCEPLVAASA